MNWRKLFTITWKLLMVLLLIIQAIAGVLGDLFS